MLTPPPDLPERDLATLLRDLWRLDAEGLDYRAVGFGSHHWVVTAAHGARSFLTVDELAVDDAFDRLGAAFTTAAVLRERGAAFVVAPTPTIEGEAVARLPPRFAAALYPYVEGESFAWADRSNPIVCEAMLDLVAALHAMSPAGTPAHVEDFAVPARDLLEGAPLADAGAYSGRTRERLRAHADALRAALARHDELVERTCRAARLPVLTHGEPHPANAMRTAAGWVLVDWDTVLIAPPERDLWHLDRGDGSMLRRYADATGREPDPVAIELYRGLWDLKDLGAYVARFNAPHVGDANDDKSWTGVCVVLDRLSS